MADIELPERLRRKPCFAQTVEQRALASKETKLKNVYDACACVGKQTFNLSKLVRCQQHHASLRQGFCLSPQSVCVIHSSYVKK